MNRRGPKLKSVSSVETLRKRILAARGKIPADIVLKKGRVLNVFTGTIEEQDVALFEGFIVGVGNDYHGKKEIDVSSKWITPGLIDGHIHIESSMLLPSRLAAALLPHGATTIIADPHEIANVLGMDGIRFMIKESEGIPFDVFFMAPSCVPATPLESSGARLGASDLSELKTEPRVLGLAEMMNYPGVLDGEEDVLEKLSLFADRIVDGHAPFLNGFDLQGYLSAGIKSDHETSDSSEGLEKLKGGMTLMIREGTSARNLEDLLPLVKAGHTRKVCFVSDDLHPRAIIKRGHLDFVIRRAVTLGLKPEIAIQLATLNPAEYFGLMNRGAIAPGYCADVVVLGDLEQFVVEKVFKDGRLVVEGGELLAFPSGPVDSFDSRPLNIGPITADRFRIQKEGERVRIIDLIPGQVLTGIHVENVTSEDGYILSDTKSDVLKLAVVERHRGTGRIGLGLVRGFGLKSGAMATSVAHDSHNVIVVGVDDQDMCRAVETVRDMGGGMVVVRDGETIAKTPLQAAGLMSMESVDPLVGQLEALDEAAVSLGCKVKDPFMALSFLALPVIPDLKLTDMGLVDVNKFSVISLFVEDE